MVDRFIQQAIAQRLTPIYENVFSDYSYGFRNRFTIITAHEIKEIVKLTIANCKKSDGLMLFLGF